MSTRYSSTYLNVLWKGLTWEMTKFYGAQRDSKCVSEFASFGKDISLEARVGRLAGFGS